MERLSRGARKHNREEKAKARKEGRTPNLLFVSKTSKELRAALKYRRIAEKMYSKIFGREQRFILARGGTVYHRRESGY